jgi:PPM family protein phosphatase
MNCPSCHTAITETDRFCEECGAAVHAPPAAAPSAPTAPGTCAKCGAAASADADGFCSQCGFRAEPGPDARWTITLSPTFAGVSDPGRKHRRNEDHMALQTVGAAQILVVCDGVSSSHQPERASQAASAAASASLATALDQAQPVIASLHQAFSATQVAVCQAAQAIPAAQEPPSTTMVAAVVENRRATIGWLGDSRAYWLAATGSQQLSRDDSWVNDIVAADRMSQAEAEKSPNAHAITRWLGADAGGDVAPTVVQFALPGPGYLLLCSDGLWNYAPTAAQLTELVNFADDAITVAQRLTEFALAQGGHDNITVAALKIEP